MCVSPDISQTLIIVCAQKSFSRGKRQPTPNLSQEGKTGEIGMSEDVGVTIVRMIFLPNYAPKIRSFLSIKS
ncbi:MULTISPECIES: hypothetical protein [Okeania]|uniref:hypothetical protein n=1 Tax=Okeania TaxID=1458928 RepID=UPI000F5357A9|nr:MULTISPECIES: hypothetical protein [Okeania]NET22430.1 hypothetical protein [Okeania sp. SIO1H5]NET79212.1 hypothetical protein [Okeania sp. SIO1F9]NET96074.1 hypothetical protein [Okeania sp. SIO1H2]